MLNQQTNHSGKKHLQVGILEVRRHPAVLYTFCKICNTLKTTVTVYTTQDLFDRLKTWLDNSDQFNFIIKKKKQSLKSFLHQAESHCEKHLDVLFVNTIHETWYDLFHFSRFNPKITKILTLHHVNAWLHPTVQQNHVAPFRRIINRIMRPMMDKIINYYDAINVIYPPLKDYIEKQTTYQKHVFTIPSAVFEEKNIAQPTNDSKKVILTIPGLVQKHRKDFHMALSALQKIPESYLNNMQLILLGTAFDREGKNIIENFQKLSKNGLTVQTFDEFIADETFYNIIQKSDILFLPIKIHTRSDNGISEIYGQTVGSGVIYDAIKYAKPVILPDSFNLFPQFNKASMTYDSTTSLQQIIIKCIGKPSYIKEKKHEALRLAQAFSLKDFQQYFQDNILLWVQDQET